MGSSSSSIMSSDSTSLPCNHALSKCLKMIWNRPSKWIVQMDHALEDSLDAPKHYSTMFAKLNDMRITAELTDTELHYGNTVYPCHSIVLFCRSCYFEKVISELQALTFTSGDSSCKLYEIVIPKKQMKQDVFEDLLTFIYLGRISIPKERLDEYLVAAKEWDLHYIRSSEKVSLGQYAHHSPTSFVFRKVFSDEELLSPFLTIKEKSFEANVMKKLSVFCPLPRSLHEMQKVIPPFDIFICVENGSRIYCHRTLLASYSEYFYAMLGTSNFIESLSDNVVLKGVEASVIVSVIEFIYSTNICLTEETAHSLTATVDWLCPRSSLSTKAQKYLVQSLSHENCVRNLLFAETYSLDYLHEEAAKLARNLSAVARSDCFAELTFDELCFYLSNSDLSVLNEMEVFFAYESWAKDKHDKDMTYDAFKKVVRLSLLSSSQLRTVVSLLSSSSRPSKKLPSLSCSALIERDCKTALKLSMEDPVEIRASLYKQSFRNCAKQFMLFIDYCSPWSMECVFHVYHIHFQNGESKSSDSRPLVLRPCCAKSEKKSCTGSYAVAVYNNSMYITGGYCLHRPTNKTLIYHPSDDKCWRNGPPLLIPRYCHCMVAIEDSLYVIGGFNSDRSLVKTVERLVYSKMEWAFETTLLSAAPNTVCVGFGGTIYMFAMSRLNNFIYASLHCYCTKKRTWLQPTSLGFKVAKKSIFFSDVVVCNGKIYVFAEETEDGAFTTISVFDPVGETWHPNLVELQGTYSAFLHNDELFICKSIPNTDFLFEEINLLRNPLSIDPLIVPETPSVDKQSLIYNLPMGGNERGNCWLKALIHMKKHQKRDRPAFLQLHSYYPQSDPRPSLLV